MSTADEIRLPGELPLWEVPGWKERFGVVAGITGRGDDPADPFDLGLWNEQPVRAAMGRWRKFRSGQAGFDRFVMAHQVHGASVLWHPALPKAMTTFEGADGHATDDTGLLMLVTVADCVPVYLFDPVHRVAALLHAGWRGTAGGMLARGLEALAQHASTRSRDVVMHCGVAISGRAYEVGPEVLEALGRDRPAELHAHLDLRDELARQGGELGIVDISVSSHCSATERRSFFSHRGSGGSDGRMVAYLGLLP